MCFDQGGKSRFQLLEEERLKKARATLPPEQQCKCNGSCLRGHKKNKCGSQRDGRNKKCRTCTRHINKLKEDRSYKDIEVV